MPPLKDEWWCGVDADGKRRCMGCGKLDVLECGVFELAPGRRFCYACWQTDYPYRVSRGGQTVTQGRDAIRVAANVLVIPPAHARYTRRHMKAAQRGKRAVR